MTDHARSAWPSSPPRPALNVTFRPEVVSVFLIETNDEMTSSQLASNAMRPRKITFCAFMIIIAFTSSEYPPMSALKLIMTTAGLGRFTAAQAGDDIDLTIARVGLTASAFVAAPSLTALPGEFRRLSTVSGSVEAQNIVHMTVTDDEAISYTVLGFGLFLTDGTLFAAYSQPTTIAEKSSGSMLALAIDIAFPAAGVDQITFGSTDFLNPPASTDRKGVVELATLAEANAGDTFRVTTGAVVKAMIADAVAAIAQALSGITSRTLYGSGLVKGGGDLTANRTFTVDAATAADIRAGARGDMAVTPAALRAAGTASFVENGRRVSPDGYVEIWGVSPT